jgi:Mn2+/Fe2+ NRAMP family transporter
VKKFLAVTLGILTAIGGFVDMGDLVANAEAGARFGVALVGVVVVGVFGIVVYAEMAGRVAAVTTRPVFDLVRERVGPRFALANLIASFLINLLTLTAEIAGVAIAVSLLVSVSYVLLIPVAALAVWLVIWRLPFEWMERMFGLCGLALVVFVVAVFHLGPDWGELAGQVIRPTIPESESVATAAFFAVALLGAAMTPYEVFFFSSGAVEERWTTQDLNLNRANVFIGFPLGGILSVAIMAGAALVLRPADVTVEDLSQVALPVSVALGRVGLAVVIFGIFAATFGAALETALSSGYSVSQYLGWQWGKFVAPRRAARFHTTMLAALVVGTVIGMSGVDPVKVTEYSIVLSAAALPLTYLPIFVVANDPQFMGTRANGPLANALGTAYLVLLSAVSLAAIPLIIITRGGTG